MTNLIPELPWAHAVLLGLVQGATEFLPVSSTGHIRILPAELGWPDPGAAFSAIVQLGPIAAIISFFWKDLIKYCQGVAKSLQSGKRWNDEDLDARLGWYTLFGTVPFVIVGAVLHKTIETTFRSLVYVALSLIILALLLLIAEFVGKRTAGLEKLTLRDSIAIGVAQVFSFVPGASRSGTTITAALFLGFDREAAARFSFLLSIPAITLAGLYQIKSALKGSHLSGHILGPYLLATVIAGVVAYVVIRWLLGYLGKENHSTIPFVVWRIALGVLILVQLHTGALHNDTGADIAPPAQPSQASRMTTSPAIVGENITPERHDSRSPSGDAANHAAVAGVNGGKSVVYYDYKPDTVVHTNV